MPRWEVAAAAAAGLGEGPVWDDRAGCLFFVDIEQRSIHRLNPASGETGVKEVGSAVSAAIPRRDGGLVLALADGLYFYEWDTEELRLATPLDDPLGPRQRMNDAKCDPRGRLWAGRTAADPRAGISSLYRFGKQGAELVVPDCALANGLGWSPDGALMYFVDSRKHTVYEFDYDLDRGSMSNGRTFISVPETDGFADGMTVDAEGFVWIALYFGSRVQRYAPDGTLADAIDFPVSKVTSVCFGGSKLTDLYVTSASMGLSAAELEDQPYAGYLFVVPDAGQGLPSVRFDPTTINPLDVRSTS